MLQNKWQRMVAVGLLVLTSLLPVSAALAASAAEPASGVAYSTCLQRIREDLGTVLPKGFSPQQCDRLGSAGNGLIPVTGEVNGSVSWRDVGANFSLIDTGGWHDVGAGHR
jgi:hypothetical protein